MTKKYYNPLQLRMAGGRADTAAGTPCIIIMIIKPAREARGPEGPAR